MSPLPLPKPPPILRSTDPYHLLYWLLVQNEENVIFQVSSSQTLRRMSSIQYLPFPPSFKLIVMELTNSETSTSKPCPVCHSTSFLPDNVGASRLTLLPPRPHLLFCRLSGAIYNVNISELSTGYCVYTWPAGELCDPRSARLPSKAERGLQSIWRHLVVVAEFCVSRFLSISGFLLFLTKECMLRQLVPFGFFVLFLFLVGYP